MKQNNIQYIKLAISLVYILCIDWPEMFLETLLKNCDNAGETNNVRYTVYWTVQLKNKQLQ